jgi:hypothetical protein
MLEPVLKRDGRGGYDSVPEGTLPIVAGDIMRGDRGWYMCGRLGLHGVDPAKGEFYGIAGFKTGSAAAFQLLKQRGFMDWEARA